MLVREAAFLPACISIPSFPESTTELVGRGVGGVNEGTEEMEEEPRGLSE